MSLLFPEMFLELPQTTLLSKLIQGNKPLFLTNHKPLIANFLTHTSRHILTHLHRDHMTTELCAPLWSTSQKCHRTLEWLYRCVVSRGTSRSTGQSSLVIVLERGGVCRGLDPGSCWPASHLVSVSTNPREGRLLALPVASRNNANLSEVKTQKCG